MTNETATARLPGALRLWVTMSTVIVVIGAAFAMFFRLDHVGDIGFVLSTAFAGYSAVLVVIAVPAAWYLSRPLVRLQRALDEGVSTLDLPAKDVRAVLRLPTRIVIAVMVHGVLVGVGFAVVVEMQADARYAPWPVFVVGGTALAAISGMAHASALRRVVFKQIAPVLLREGTLEHLGVGEMYGAEGPKGNITGVTMTWHHILGIVLTLGMSWPVLGYLVLKYGEAPGPLASLILAALYVVLAAQQITNVLLSVSRPMGHLRDRMIEVERGDLNVRATVFGLDTYGILSSSFNRMVDGLKQREQLKETFGRYVTKQVADEILAGRVSLGGERKTATVLFSDIRGFTSMSEQMSPEEVVGFLNEYLTMMVDCVIEHGGVLDKFIGDAIMAVFGVPLSLGSVEADAAAAVACATAMGERLDALNAKRVEEGKAPIAIGIGLHTGELVAGNIGSPKRMQYTVIGDTVNVGSRLESLTKEQKRRTIVSGSTAALIDGAGLVDLGTVTVRGRHEPLAIFGLAIEGPTVAV